MGNATDKECPHYPLSVILTVRDTARSVAFYRDQLGFALEQAWPDEKQPMWANLMLDGQSVMVGSPMPVEQIEQWFQGDPNECAFKVRQAQAFEKSKCGVGISTYVMVPDIDAYHATLLKRGVKVALPPKTQFYGLRELTIEDPDGYTMIFYTLVKMANCQSCSMPLTDAKPGQMYCGYCVDEHGKLKAYETILEGCISGYFIPMQKMSRPDAEKAAREMLAKQPAWANKGA